MDITATEANSHWATGGAFSNQFAFKFRTSSASRSHSVAVLRQAWRADCVSALSAFCSASSANSLKAAPSLSNLSLWDAINCLDLPSDLFVVGDLGELSKSKIGEVQMRAVLLCVFVPNHRLCGLPFAVFRTTELARYDAPRPSNPRRIESPRAALGVVVLRCARRLGAPIHGPRLPPPFRRSVSIAFTTLSHVVKPSVSP